ncbi:TetR/AcrR family transcriptional regulator [Bacillus sonorensis]|uniref:Transcriptional regulator n=2 Tax=Bacillus sonorensis TaxID=119858 RepID=M5PAV8_9BACI|nr:MULTISPECIES: TetR/AcrR family transcriptional regulator [Bacillus]TWK74135.1 putative HTH-type transcriptional regulator YfiR [Bacillus paralicheniformis]ASB87833.1 putative HTH-type transcriptional regulator YhgD [Bacillus sonorensis]EME76683.1 transcriptional regulator [Bacillus sonorensis L12]MBG9915744.1 TetR family transcriptional regulator [Bacillus sonorensis]MCF7617168.1 TetR/AcrR family transcriptional regulator [Bacillus sonorensis]
MVRRRLTQEERKKETRKLLLEAAVEIFAQMGFYGATVDKIAEHAGFSKGAFYAHFHSKEELFLTILEQQMEAHVDNIRNVIKQHQSLSHFIETIDKYFLSVAQKNRTLSMLNMEFLLYAMREESVRHKWSGMITESVKQISKAINELMLSENYESDLSTDEIAWTILSLENGMAIFYYINQDLMPLNLYGKSLRNMLLPHIKEEN